MVRAKCAFASARPSSELKPDAHIRARSSTHSPAHSPAPHSTPPPSSRWHQARVTMAYGMTLNGILVGPVSAVLLALCAALTFSSGATVQGAALTTVVKAGDVSQAFSSPFTAACSSSSPYLPSAIMSPRSDHASTPGWIKRAKRSAGTLPFNLEVISRLTGLSPPRPKRSLQKAATNVRWTSSSQVKRWANINSASRIRPLRLKKSSTSTLPSRASQGCRCRSARRRCSRSIPRPWRRVLERYSSSSPPLEGRRGISELGKTEALIQSRAHSAFRRCAKGFRKRQMRLTLYSFAHNQVKALLLFRHRVRPHHRHQLRASQPDTLPL